MAPDYLFVGVFDVGRVLNFALLLYLDGTGRNLGGTKFVEGVVRINLVSRVCCRTFFDAVAGTYSGRSTCFFSWNKLVLNVLIVFGGRLGSMVGIGLLELGGVRLGGRFVPVGQELTLVLNYFFATRPVACIIVH